MSVKTPCNVLLEIGLIALVLLPPIAFGAVRPTHVAIIQAGILAMFCLWVIKTFCKRGFTYVRTPLDLPMLAFLVWGIVNVAFSTYSHASEKELYRFANYALLFSIAGYYFSRRRRLFSLVYAIIFLGVAESLFGLAQYLQGAKTVLGYAVSNIGTVNGAYVSHNHFAGLLVMIFPLVLALFFGTSQPGRRFFLFLLLCIIGAALILSLSRGGLLSWGVSLFVFFLCLWLKHRQSRGRATLFVFVLLLALVITVFTAWIGVSPIAHRSLLTTLLPTTETFQEEIRFVIWRHALPLIKEFPVFGSGLGTFSDVFARYRPAEIPQEKRVYHAHNDYLELLIEAGGIGLLLALWGMFALLRTALKAYFRHSSQELPMLVLGGVASCTAIFTHSLVDFNLHIPANAIIFFLILALTTASVRLLGQQRKRRSKASSRPQPSFVPSPHPISLWGIGLIACGIIAGLAWNFRSNIALSYHHKAQRISPRQNLFEPIELYQKALQFDGGNILLHQNLADHYATLARMTPYAEKWYQLAAESYQTAITLNHYTSPLYYKLGWIYVELGRAQEAADAFKQAIAYDPKIAFYYENLGNYYFSFDLLEPALRMYQEAIRLDPQKMADLIVLLEKHEVTYDTYQAMIPEESSYRQQFAALLQQQGDWEHSKQAYRQALELSGGQPEYYQAMLSACQAKKDFECLRTLWQDLWRQSPESLEYPIRIAESFASQQEWARAIASYETLVREHPAVDVNIYMRLAELYRQQGRIEDALQSYRRLLDQRPADINLYHEIAKIYRQQGDWQAAIETYTHALKSGLTHPELHSQLGALLLKTGNQRQALTSYEQAIQAGETRISVYQTLERLYQAQNNTIALDLLWENYLLANRQNPEAIFQLVQHYAAAGEWLEAVTLSKELIANAPINTNYRTFLAGLYEQQSMFYEAIEQWEKLVKLNTQNLDYKMHLAGLYEHVNQTENARLQYRRILRIQPDHQEAQQRLAQLGE